GHYVCRATNRHGVAVRSVLVTVEYQPSIAERGCPERRLWLEGTPARLRCAAAGNPPPRVTCAKLGTEAYTRDNGDNGDIPAATATATLGPPGDSQATPNVTRGHAGTYQCRATNAHGSATRNVTVAVEYGPVGVTVRALPSANVTRGGGFTLECGAEAVPPPGYTWAVPPATNLRLAPDNRSVTVTGATAANRGLYTCTASNRHGRREGSVLVRVDGEDGRGHGDSLGDTPGGGLTGCCRPAENWAVLLVALGALGGVAALGSALAGGYYLKTTACKKGEYNVRDAEGSSEAACLHRQRDNRGDIFGIQLTQP
ncbi:ICAM5 protein, partial [Daphoenositta chrysoptera]|nr:ICAM5 protein [Daphoenositta chrysoptera]